MTARPKWLDNPWLAYGASAALATLAVLVRVSLHAVFQEQSRFFLLLPVVLVCSLYGGVGPGAISVVVGSTLSFLLLVPAGGQTKDLAALVVFLLICVGVLWLTHRERVERRHRMEFERRLEAANKRLEEANVELEAKVLERTAALKAANDELEGFCYSMAHDLRTPSRAIAGNARILVEDYGDRLPSDLDVHLARINKAALKLGALLDGLLTYARLARQELAPAEIDISKMVREIVESDARRAHIDVRLDVEDGCRVWADEKQMRTLVRALAENSLLYRKDGAPAVIRVRSESNDSFLFEDEGIGFDMTYLAKVFQPFERLHRDEAYPGVGIGLANVDRVVRRHGGSVKIESAPGHGTRVRIRVPRHAEVATKEPVGALGS